MKHFGYIEIFYHTHEEMRSSMFSDSSMLDESLLQMERYVEGDPHNTLSLFRSLWWSWEAESIVEAYAETNPFGSPFRYRDDLWWLSAWEGTNV